MVIIRAILIISFFEKGEQPESHSPEGNEIINCSSRVCLTDYSASGAP